MEFAETRLTSPNPSSPNFAEEHLSSGPTIADAFSIVLDSTLSGIHQELPDSSSSNVKNDFILKADSSFAVNSTSSRKSEKSQSQTQNLILLMDQLDPMLSWDLIAQKIHSKYSIFEELIERTKAKLPCQNDPVQFFQLLLCQVDELLGQLKQMIQECCYAKADQEEHFSTSSQHYLQLTDSQSMYLFGNNCMTLNLKNLNELPEKYKVKIFNHSPGENTKNEDSNLNTEENVKEKNDGRKLSQNNKKKRSRQKFSQCDKCYKSWNDVRSYELHLKEPGKCPGKPWFKLLPGKKYSCIHPMCGGAYLEFQDQSNYWNHVRERHWVEEDLVINCPHCREKFPLLEMMKFHVKFSHPKTKMCRFCGSVFATKNDLAKHERTHTGEKPFACDKCTFRTSTAGTLRGHIKRRHEDPNLHRTFVCNQCEKGFFSAFDLKQHILTHSDIKRYTCPACGKQLKNDSCYRRHMMCVHGQKFSCDICNKDFSAPMGLSIHRRDVHGIVC